MTITAQFRIYSDDEKTHRSSEMMEFVIKGEDSQTLMLTIYELLGKMLEKGKVNND